jgi:hypothetical protein
VTENVDFDNLPDHEKKPMVGILNLTEWFRIYSNDYVRNVFEHVVRNRQDEIYLTDNDCSVVALADYWSPGDPLLFYQLDLILATLFELSRLTHLRYLAYYLRSAPEALGALTLNSESGRMALSFVLDVERVVAGSSYDHPAEALIQHGFTRRFLKQIVIQRGTRSSLEELDAFVERVARALELRTGLDLSEMDVGISRRIWVVTVGAFLVAIIGVIVAIVIGIGSTSSSEVPPPESTTTTISRPTTTAPRP